MKVNQSETSQVPGSTGELQRMLRICEAADKQYEQLAEAVHAMHAEVKRQANRIAALEQRVDKLQEPVAGTRH